MGRGKGRKRSSWFELRSGGAAARRGKKEQQQGVGEEEEQQGREVWGSAVVLVAEVWMEWWQEAMVVLVNGWRSGADVEVVQMDGDGGGWAAEVHHHAGLAMAVA